MIQSKLQAALWGFFSGDAIAAPTHWYYGGARQVMADYNLIKDYVKPKHDLFGSIMNKSNTNGGGRGRFSKGKGGISIIGDVINHGKWEYWNPRKSVHYHATLQAGENTLEASLARVLMKSIVANDGKFEQEHFRKAYIEFMTTPGTHNDTYASTCHRMFFANLVFYERDPKDCPDNDGHNVDTIDGLILPTITALAYSLSTDREEAYDAIAQTIAVTRNSPTLLHMSRPMANVIWDALNVEANSDRDKSLENSLVAATKALGMRAPRISQHDGISACYLNDSLPPLFDMILKYSSHFNDVWTGVIANARAGGENVHRGSILGAVLGAAAGKDALPKNMINGLYHKEQLEKEINQFVECILKNHESSYSKRNEF